MVLSFVSLFIFSLYVILQYSFSDLCAQLVNLLHVVPKAQAIAPDAEPEEEAQGQEYAHSHVAAGIVEGPCMRIGHQDGQIVQAGQSVQ